MSRGALPRPPPVRPVASERKNCQEPGAAPMAMSGAKRIPELEVRRIRIEQDFDENQVQDAF